jgi:TRAP-type C4-dicarboxylate transport system permease large subunit
MEVLKFLFAVVSVLIAAVIIIWATSILIRNLWRGEPKRRSFKEWAKSVWEAFWGL